MSARGIHILGASAGSGKTHRLTREVTSAVDPSGPEPLGVEGLFAVTFTNHAQAELSARVRQALISAGAFETAMRLPLAQLGTVHAACLRLLQEFALDAGLSPEVDVMAGDADALLRRALEAALPPALRERIDELAQRFELRLNPRLRRHDWLTPVGDIMDLARSNRIAPETLTEMAKRSAAGLLAQLPPPRPCAKTLDDALAAELGRAASALGAVVKPAKKTIDVRDVVQEALKDSAYGALPWPIWAKLAALEPAKAERDAVARLLEAASEHERHPRLHEELRELTLLMFEAARVGLVAYAESKAERGVVDYTDMLDGALTLLSNPRVRSVLKDRVRFVAVDEFQDTSPIQLAFFVALHRLAGRSVWVGDRKQCIFEFAGADPALMDAVSGWVATSGGEREQLGDNYRSRPELVELASELFTAAMAPHGFTRQEVAVAPARSTTPALAAGAPTSVWWLEAKNAEDACECIAGGVARMLAHPDETLVEDRVTRVVRGVRPGDIAVLVATNDAALQVATALHARGIRAAVARAGLLSTPEGTLVDAALRYLLDDRDALALATLEALHGFGNEGADAWLAARVAGTTGESPAWKTALEGVRGQLSFLSPCEAVEQVLAALDAVMLCARWPDAAQRLANLDAVRALPGEYESRCMQSREAATVAGLLRYFDDARAKRLRRDEEIALDDQHVPTDADAVTVCTYHKSKGREWPVMVLGSLDREPKRPVFNVCLESDQEGFDPEVPLAGRWIRYWPWPYGALRKVPLGPVAEASPEGVRACEREERERVRLLYVGFTRARDHLVLAVRANGKPDGTRTVKKAWLDALQNEEGKALLGLPDEISTPGTAQMRVRASGEGVGCAVPTRVWRLSPERGDDEREPETPGVWYARPRADPLIERPAYRIAPSRAREEWPTLVLPSVLQAVRLPGAMPIEAAVAARDELGNAVHAFFAADHPALTLDERLACAHRLLSSQALLGAVRPEALVAAADRFRVFVDARWPGAVWRTEVPVEALVETPQGRRRVAGTIDLLLETAGGCVIIDHKTFSGATEAAWRKKTEEFLPQLAAYADVLSKSGAPCSTWIHYPVGGGVVAISVA